MGRWSGGRRIEEKVIGGRLVGGRLVGGSVVDGFDKTHIVSLVGRYKTP